MEFAEGVRVPILIAFLVAVKLVLVKAGISIILKLAVFAVVESVTDIFKPEAVPEAPENVGFSSCSVPLAPIYDLNSTPIPIRVEPESGPVMFKRLPVFAPAEVTEVPEIFKAFPVVRLLAFIAIAVARVLEESSIRKPIPAVVRTPVKLKRTIPLVVVPAVSLVSDIRLLVLVALLEFMVRSLVRLAAPASLIFSKLPVLPAFEAPAMEMFTRLPVNPVSAPVVFTLRREPTLAPAVVMPVPVLVIFTKVLVVAALSDTLIAVSHPEPILMAVSTADVPVIPSISKPEKVSSAEPVIGSKSR